MCFVCVLLYKSLPVFAFYYFIKQRTYINKVIKKRYNESYISDTDYQFTLEE